jgi:hypothetical protein
MTTLSPSPASAPSESAPAKFTGQLPEIDPLLCQVALPLRAVFYPYGFAIEIITNAQPVLDAVAESWGHFTLRRLGPPLQFRVTVSSEGPPGCPPTPIMRARGHQLAYIADAYNYFVTDLDRGICSVWINRTTLEYPEYLRFHILESAVLTLMSNTCATPIHAACVSLNGCGILLCGDPGAGKSSLAYACARAGWTYTSDDGSYLPDGDGPPRISGNSHKVRFRPSAATLFPEIGGRILTPRAVGKPSIEIPTSTLPGLKTAEEAQVHHIVFLNRQPSAVAELLPVPREVAWQRLFDLIYPEDQQRQASVIARLSSVAVHELRYRDLHHAVDRLEQLTRGIHPPTV